MVSAFLVLVSGLALGLALWCLDRILNDYL